MELEIFVLGIPKHISVIKITGKGYLMCLDCFSNFLVINILNKDLLTSWKYKNNY